MPRIKTKNRSVLKVDDNIRVFKQLLKNFEASALQARNGNNIHSLGVVTASQTLCEMIEKNPKWMAKLVILMNRNKDAICHKGTRLEPKPMDYRDILDEKFLLNRGEIAVHATGSELESLCKNEADLSVYFGDPTAAGVQMYIKIKARFGMLRMACLIHHICR